MTTLTRRLFALFGLCISLISVSSIFGQNPKQDAIAQSPNSGLSAESQIQQNPKLAAQLSLALQHEETGIELRGHATKTATTYLEKALSIHEQLNNEEGVLRVSRALGTCYSLLSDHDKALKYYFPVMVSYTELRDTQEVLKMHSLISSVYDKKRDYAQAFYHGKAALRLSKKLGFMRGIAAEANNLAGLYRKVDSIDVAFGLLRTAEKINHEMSNQQWLAVNYAMYSELYKQLGKSDSVRYYLDKMLALLPHQESASDSIAVFRKLGVYHYEMGQSDSALSYFNGAMRLSAKIGSLWSEANLNHWISAVYENIGETQMAIAYLNTYYDLKDSIYRQQNRGEMEAMRALYEVNQLEDSLALSQVNEALAQKEVRQKQNQLYTVSGIFLLLFTFGLVIFIQLRKQSRSNAHLLKMNLEAQKVNDSSPKYASSSLSDAKIEPILKSLRTLMNEEQLFTDQTLKLEILAERLEVSRTYLSQVINQTFSQNFSAYINAHRVELAKTYLVSEAYKAYSIQGVAETVGFKSLSAFNTAFKKETGLTPSYYRKNANQKKA